MLKTLYMVIERYKSQDSAPIYDRFRDEGRMNPEGLLSITGWDDPKSGICYQIMETSDPTTFDEWIAKWNDLIDFEIHPLRTVQESLTSFKIFAAGRPLHLIIWHTVRMGRRLILHWLRGRPKSELQ